MTARMTTVLITVITGLLEVFDVLFEANWSSMYAQGIEVTLVAITPLLVWFIPRWGN